VTAAQLAFHLAVEGPADRAFQAFHEANPAVYAALVRLARQANQQGRERGGMKMLWEVMRWERYLVTDDPTGFKLNNNYTSRYARLIMESEEDLAGFFETRELHA